MEKINNLRRKIIAVVLSVCLIAVSLYIYLSYHSGFHSILINGVEHYSHPYTSLLMEKGVDGSRYTLYITHPWERKSVVDVFFKQYQSDRFVGYLVVSRSSQVTNVIGVDDSEEGLDLFDLGGEVVMSEGAVIVSNLRGNESGFIDYNFPNQEHDLSSATSFYRNADKYIELLQQHDSLEFQWLHLKREEWGPLRMNWVSK